MESPLIAGRQTEEELAAREAAEQRGERFLVYRDADGRQVIHTLAEGRTTIAYCDPVPIGSGPTLVPGELSATPRFSEQQQRILRALCRPLFDDGEGINPATDEQVAAATGIALDAVVSELDHLGRALGLEDMPVADQRAEIALLAMRSGLVSADEGG